MKDAIIVGLITTLISVSLSIILNQIITRVGKLKIIIRENKICKKSIYVWLDFCNNANESKLLSDLSIKFYCNKKEIYRNYFQDREDTNETSVGPIMKKLSSFTVSQKGLVNKSLYADFNVDLNNCNRISIEYFNGKKYKEITLFKFEKNLETFIEKTKNKKIDW